MNTFENHPGEKGDVPGWAVIVLGIWHLLRRGEAFRPPFEPHRSTQQSETNQFRMIPTFMRHLFGIRLGCDPSTANA